MSYLWTPKPCVLRPSQPSPKPAGLPQTQDPHRQCTETWGLSPPAFPGGLQGECWACRQAWPPPLTRVTTLTSRTPCQGARQSQSDIPTHTLYIPTPHMQTCTPPTWALTSHTSLPTNLHSHTWVPSHILVGILTDTQLDTHMLACPLNLQLTPPHPAPLTHRPRLLYTLLPTHPHSWAPTHLFPTHLLIHQPGHPLTHRPMRWAHLDTTHPTPVHLGAFRHSPMPS
jgi:hypothetical protein